MELALSISERKIIKPEYVGYRPVGAIMVGRSAEQIKRKWAEIICVLCSKYVSMYTGFQYMPMLSSFWKKEWYDAYFQHERDAKKMTLETLWNLITKDGNVLSLLPKEPLGTCHITETWNWSDTERKMFCLCSLDESNMTAVEKETIDKKGEYQVGHETWLGPVNRIDFKTDIGLSAKELADIQNSDKIVHPKLNVALPKTIIKQTIGQVSIIGD